MQLLADHCDICKQIVQLLSEDFHALYQKFRICTRTSAPRQKETCDMAVKWSMFASTRLASFLSLRQRAMILYLKANNQTQGD